MAACKIVATTMVAMVNTFEVPMTVVVGTRGKSIKIGYQEEAAAKAHDGT